MKKIAFLGFVLALGSASVLTSCSKYEEGPKFTLLSKKNRVTNDWNLTAVADSNGTSLALGGTTMSMSIMEDGTFTAKVTNILTVDGTGTWKFTDSKEELILTLDNVLPFFPDNGNTIVKLAKDELKLRNDSDNYVYTFSAN